MLIKTFRLNYLDDEKVYKTYKIDVALLVFTVFLIAADIVLHVIY